MKRRALTPQQVQEARNTRILAEAVYHHVTEASGRQPARRSAVADVLLPILGWMLLAAIIAGAIALFTAASQPRQEAQTHVDFLPKCHAVHRRAP